jgi:hypothetical protein
MTDDIASRVRTLLAENPRICGFGCNVREYDRETRTYVPKKRDGFSYDGVEITDAQVERFKKMCAFIEKNMPHDDWRGGRKLIGSYGFKHVLERNAWTEDNNRYVSNGEGMVALMLCGYTPRWDKDDTNPNCVFSVRGKRYMQLVENAQRPNYSKKAEQVSAP